MSWKSFNAFSVFSSSHMVNPLVMNTFYNCSLKRAINYSWCCTKCRDRWKRRSEMGGVVLSFLVFNSCEVLPGKKACWESFGILWLSHFGIISGSFNIFQKECFCSLAEIPWLRRLPLVATNKLPKSLCQSPFRSDEHFQPIWVARFFLPPTNLWLDYTLRKVRNHWNRQVTCHLC